MELTDKCFLSNKSFFSQLISPTIQDSFKAQLSPYTNLSKIIKTKILTIKAIINLIFVSLEILIDIFFILKINFQILFHLTSEIKEVFGVKRKKFGKIALVCLWRKLSNFPFIHCYTPR